MRYNVPPNWPRKHQNAVQFEVWRLCSPLRLPRGTACFVRPGEAVPPMGERQSVVYLAMVLLRQPARILWSPVIATGTRYFMCAKEVVRPMGNH